MGSNVIKVTVMKKRKNFANETFFFTKNLRNGDKTKKYQYSKMMDVYSLVCPPGWYGKNCSKECGPNCKSSCERFKGICKHGCKPGWKGSYCDMRNYASYKYHFLDKALNKYILSKLMCY